MWIGVGAAAALCLLLIPGAELSCAVAIVIATAFLAPGLISEASILNPVIGLAILLTAFVRLGRTRLPLNRQALGMGLMAAAVTAYAQLQVGSSVQAVALLAASIGAAALMIAKMARPAVVLDVCVLFAMCAGWQVVGYVVGVLFGDAATFGFTAGARAGWNYSVSFLGSITVGSGGFLGGLPRLTFWFGEPGIFGAILAIAALMHLAVGRKFDLKIQVPLIAALCLTQSLAGLAAYTIGFALEVLSGRAVPGLSRFESRAVGTILGLGAAAILFGGGSIGLSAKQASNDASISDRLDGVGPSEFWQALSAQPFGNQSTNPLANINLLQSSLTHGVIVLLGWLSIYVLCTQNSRGGAASLLGPRAALLLTVLVAQPPYFQVWIVLASLLTVDTADIGSPVIPATSEVVRS